MLDMVNEWIMALILGILKIVDAFHNLFNIVVGIDDIHTGGGKSATLWDYLIAQTPLNNVFWGMFILSIVIGSVFCLVAVLKNMFGWNDGGKRRSSLKILGQYGFSILGTYMFCILFMLFIDVVNVILQEVYYITSNGQETTVGTALLRMLVPESAYLSNPKKDIFVDMSVFELFGQLNTNPVTNIPTGGWTVSTDPNNPGGIINGAMVEYALGILASLSILAVIAIAIVLMIKRLYDLIILFVMMPPVMATICYDDGQKFKAWRESVFSTAILAYGSVIAINIYIIVCAGITNLEAPISGLGGTWFEDAVLKIVLMIGGAFAISGSHILISRVMGTSAEEGRQMAQAFRTGLAVTGTAVGAAKAVGRFTGGFLGNNGNAVTRTLGISRNQQQLRTSMQTNKQNNMYKGFRGGLARASDYVSSHGAVGTVLAGMGHAGKYISKRASTLKGPTTGELLSGKALKNKGVKDVLNTKK